jgi:hypothetical protein
LDVKLSGFVHVLTYYLSYHRTDFGVSLWVDSTDEGKKKPFYVGQKGIYEMANVEHSYNYSFDMRYFISYLVAKKM